MPALLLYHSAQQQGWQTMQKVTVAKKLSVRGKASLTVILLLFGLPLSTVKKEGKSDREEDLEIFALSSSLSVERRRGSTKVIAKVIVAGRSHVDYGGFVEHSCCHFATWLTTLFTTAAAISAPDGT